MSQWARESLELTPAPASITCVSAPSTARGRKGWGQSESWAGIHRSPPKGESAGATREQGNVGAFVKSASCHSLDERDRAQHVPTGDGLAGRSKEKNAGFIGADGSGDALTEQKKSQVAGQ